MHSRHSIRGSRGMTLIETVLAMGISAVLALGLIAASTTADRLTANLPYDLFATQLVSKIAEDLRAENYDDVGTSRLPLYNSPMTFPFDPDDPDGGPTYTVTVKFKGFGYASDLSGVNTLKIDLPSGDSGWDDDEWAGYIVTIKDGAGSGQCALVKSSLKDKLILTRDLKGTSLLNWVQQPDHTSYFEIGGGKTVVITATWPLWGKNHSKFMTTMLLR